MALTPTSDIRPALVVSLRSRVGVNAGTTWGDFQRAMAAMGVRDSDEIRSIEYGCAQMGTGCIGMDEDEHGRFEVKEKTR